MTRFEELGGEDKLRAIIDRFVDLCFDDAMIGFMFQRASRERIKRFEYEHAAAFLGEGTYGGRDIRQAHKRHRVFGGHFMRRLQILREVLSELKVPREISDPWLAHHESLRAEVTNQPGSECG